MPLATQPPFRSMHLETLARQTFGRMEAVPMNCDVRA